jgi:hypothetical protein
MDDGSPMNWTGYDTGFFREDATAMAVAPIHKSGDKP